MIAQHTLLFRLIGPMQAWGYRSRFEDRDTALEPTRSGVLGLLASACGIAREETATLAAWDAMLRYGVRVDLPKVGREGPERSGFRVDLPKVGREGPERSGFRVETDFHTAQSVLRATGKGIADTVLSRRHYLADARFTVGIQSTDANLLHTLEAALKDPIWTLSLGRKSFPLALPPWLPGGGVREKMALLSALKAAPFPLLAPREQLPDEMTFVIEPNSEAGDIPPTAIPMRLADRPLDFDVRRYGLRQAAMFRLKREECGMEADRCFYQR